MSVTLKRNNTVDIAKGIGIFLVCLGHTTENEIVLKWLYSFHMPLFFFFSGVFHSQGKNYKEFLKKKAKGLLIPYFFFAVILFLFFLIISKTIGFSKGEDLSILENFIGIFIGTDIKGISQVSWGGQLWFLLALFLVSNIYYFIFNLKVKYKIILNIIFIYLNIFLSKYLNFYLPWCFLTVLMSINFYMMGNMLKENILKKEKNSNIWSIVFFIINLLALNYNIKVDMWGNQYGNLLLFFVSAYSGIFFIVLLVKNIIKKSKVLEFIGMNSLIILAFHRRIQTFTKVLFILILNKDITQRNIILDLLYSCWQIILCIPIIYILNKYFPFFTGKKEGKRL